jgi:two-component system, sporulation sensor kinase B
VIKHYLSFAKPHPAEEVELDVRMEILRTKEIIMPLALKKGVTMDVELTHIHSIKGDSNKLQQVLINVMKNGIEAMESGGSLSVISYDEKEKLFIAIQDTGIGMTYEQVTRLGEPYFSLKGTKGTGLGMMTVYQMVDAMSGKVNVQSKKCHGTTITLSFPSVTG